MLCDIEINTEILSSKMVAPYLDHQVSDEGGKPVISYGLSSAGYDIRVADEFMVFAHVPGKGSTCIDPKKFDPALLRSFKGEVFEAEPYSYNLARSFEIFKVPRDIAVNCIGKSTYARCGIIVNVTPLEPEWEGTLTLEITNTSPMPVKIYSFEGIAQLQFHRLSAPVKTSYKDRNGKYQGQTGVTPAKMKVPDGAA